MRRKPRKISRQLGRIQVTNYILKLYPDRLFAVFRKFVPLDVVHDFVTDSTIFTGVSKEFSVVAEGMQVPMYEVEKHKRRIIFSRIG